MTAAIVARFTQRCPTRGRAWPLGFQHINMLGRYSFELAEPLIRGELRSLRDASEPAEEDILVA